jgi:hypothetical protein
MLNQSQGQRKTTRRPARRAATVSFGEGRQFVNCQILDISENGARLVLPHPREELPNHFNLSWFKTKTARRDCEVVWMDRRSVAVKFTEPSP